MRLLAVSLALLSVTRADGDADGDPKNVENEVQQTDKLVFQTRLSDFKTMRESSTRNPRLNWESNGCTVVSDTPGGFNFLHACERHDFAYVNFKGQGRFYPAAKSDIDKRFYWDLISVCHEHYRHNPPKKLSKGLDLACFGWAVSYYNGVDYLGWMGEFADDVPEGLPTQRQSPVAALPDPETPGSKDPLTGLVNPVLTPGYKWIRGAFRMIY